MNECVWILLGFVAVVAIILYIIYLCNLHSRVCRLERKASPRLEIIEREVHGIGCYMRILVGLAIFFCLCVSVHYISYCYPRYIPPKQTGFDYMGVIVGVMAAMITLLVGWQIFSNIKERERIDKLAEANDKFQKEMLKFRDGLEPRMSKMEECCEERKTELSNLNSKIDVSVNSMLLLMTSDSTLTALKGKINDDRLSLTDALMLSKAFYTTLKAIHQLIQTKSDSKNIHGNVFKLNSCINYLNGKGQFNKYDYDRSIELFGEISKLDIPADMAEELQRVHQSVLAIGWDEEAERVHDFFKNLDKESQHSTP